MLQTEKNRIRILLLLVSVLGIYALDNSFIHSLVGSSLLIYALKPLFWCGIALAVFYQPALRYKGKLRNSNFVNSWSLIFAVVLICVQFLAGLVDGLGKSPYDHSVSGIAINIFSVGAVLIGREFFRSYIVNVLTREENFKIFLAVSLFMTVLAFPIQKYMDLKGYEDIVKFFCAVFLARVFKKHSCDLSCVFERTSPIFDFYGNIGGV